MVIWPALGGILGRVLKARCRPKVRWSNFELCYRAKMWVLVCLSSCSVQCVNISLAARWHECNWFQLSHSFMPPCCMHHTHSISYIQCDNTCDSGRDTMKIFTVCSLRQSCTGKRCFLEILNFIITQYAMHCRGKPLYQKQPQSIRHFNRTPTFYCISLALCR